MDSDDGAEAQLKPDLLNSISNHVIPLEPPSAKHVPFPLCSEAPAKHGDGVPTFPWNPAPSRSDCIPAPAAGQRGHCAWSRAAGSAVSACIRSVWQGSPRPGRPIGNLLFLGPTGSGKTRAVEASAEVPFGIPNAILKIDCAGFQHTHEIAKLIGSLPGYLGHARPTPRSRKRRDATSRPSL